MCEVDSLCAFTPFIFINYPVGTFFCLAGIIANRVSGCCPPDMPCSNSLLFFSCLSLVTLEGRKSHIWRFCFFFHVRLPGKGHLSKIMALLVYMEFELWSLSVSNFPFFFTMGLLYRFWLGLGSRIFSALQFLHRPFFIPDVLLWKQQFLIYLFSRAWTAPPFAIYPKQYSQAALFRSHDNESTSHTLS